MNADDVRVKELPRLLLREHRAAEILDVPPMTLRALRRSGKITAVRIGRAIYYRPEHLQEFVDRLEVAS
jgi:hypothetical protein